MARPHEDTMYIIVPFDRFMGITSAKRKAITRVSCETSAATVRHTVSGEDKILLKFNKHNWKWKGGPPAALVQLASHYTPFTRDEILVELQKSEWVGDDPLASYSFSSV